MDHRCTCLFKNGRRIYVCPSCPPLVVIESPYAGNVEANLAYAREAMLDSMRRAESPYASHLLFPQVLNDLDPVERANGIYLGFAWGRFADRVAVYHDLGITDGMKQGITRHTSRGIPVDFRLIR